MYMPGMTFHVTSRTVGKEHWYDEPLRDHILRVVAESLQFCDTLLLAYVVMSNHYHLIVRQLEDPLGILMQAIGRRIALRINSANKREGRALERPYRVSACLDPEHLRRAIWYVHQNPPAAGLCESADTYLWSSNYAYVGVPSHIASQKLSTPSFTPALRIFASEKETTGDQFIRDYKRYAMWCNECRAFPESAPNLQRPPVLAGDINWEDYNYGGEVRSRRELPDIRDFARRALREIAPDLDLELLSFRQRGNHAASVRSTLIQRLLTGGYRTSAIARHVGTAKRPYRLLPGLWPLSPKNMLLRQIFSMSKAAITLDLGLRPIS